MLCDIFGFKWDNIIVINLFIWCLVLVIGISKVIIFNIYLNIKYIKGV